MANVMSAKIKTRAWQAFSVVVADESRANGEYDVFAIAWRTAESMAKLHGVDTSKMCQYLEKRYTQETNA